MSKWLNELIRESRYERKEVYKGVSCDVIYNDKSAHIQDLWIDDSGLIQIWHTLNNGIERTRYFTYPQSKGVK